MAEFHFIRYHILRIWIFFAICKVMTTDHFYSHFEHSFRVCSENRCLLTCKWSATNDNLTKANSFIWKCPEIFGISKCISDMPASTWYYLKNLEIQSIIIWLKIWKCIHRCAVLQFFNCKWCITDNILDLMFVFLTKEKVNFCIVFTFLTQVLINHWIIEITILLWLKCWWLFRSTHFQILNDFTFILFHYSQSIQTLIPINHACAMVLLL